MDRLYIDGQRRAANQMGQVDLVIEMREKREETRGQVSQRVLCGMDWVIYYQV